MRMEIINKDEIRAMAEITMTLREWKKLRELMKDQVFGPLGSFKQQIDSMLRGVEKHFYPTEGNG